MPDQELLDDFLEALEALEALERAGSPVRNRGCERRSAGRRANTRR